MSDPILKHISDRARTRETINFWRNKVPEHVKPHPKPIYLSDGLPNGGFYPVKKITYDFIDEPFAEQHSGSLSFVHEEQDKQKKLDLRRALNYGPNKGHLHTVEFFKEFVSFANRPVYNKWDLTATNGTGDSLHKVFNLLVNPGDVVMVEAYTYVPVMNNIAAWGGQAVPLAMKFEDGGIDTVAMESMLDNWTSGPYKDKPKPKVLYTIPTGQNPTGLTLTEEKRAKVYQLAQKHDFIIVEDDPYGYIQLAKYTDGVENPFSKANSYTASSFVQSVLPKSFLEFDTDGHVIRLESVSKVFAPGTRLGFIVAHESLIEAIIDHTNCSTTAPSGISQATLLTAVDQFGGVEGWIDWCIKVSKAYTDRKNIFLKALYGSEAYEKGYFSVREPDAGMFIALEINFPEGDDHRLEMEELGYKCLEAGVQIVLGKNMAISSDYAKSAKFIRVTMATAEDDEELVEAASRLAKGIALYFES